MATRLKSIVRFLNVPAAATVQLPHGLNIDGRSVAPDFVAPQHGGFNVSVVAANVVVTNTGPGAASLDVICEHWHTIERDFGSEATLELIPQPFILEPGSGSGGDGPVSQCFIFQPDGPGVGPVVFNAWDELYAALEAARAAGAPPPGGCFSIEFDDTFVSPAEIHVPAGNYDLRGVTLTVSLDGNLAVQNVQVWCDPAVFFTNLRRLSGPFVLRSLGPVSPVALQAGQAVFLDGGAGIESDDAPFFDGSALLAGEGVAFFLDTGSYMGDAVAPVIKMPVAGTVCQAVLGSHGTIGEEALDIANGVNLVVFYKTVSSLIEDAQSAFLGSVVPIIPSTWRYRRSGHHTGPVSAPANMGDVVRCDPGLGIVDVELPAITPFNDCQTVAVVNITPSTAFGIQVHPDGADTIRGAGVSFLMNRPFEAIILCADHATLNWDIIACCDGPQSSPQ